MSEERWKNLKIWELSDDLALKIYKITQSFPRDEIYGITSQIRRAALSVPTNIVEGCARKGDKEFAHFLNISFASLSEVKYLLHFSRNMSYLSDYEYEQVSKELDDLGKALWSFYAKVKK
jgi:four helix bundle protein